MASPSFDFSALSNDSTPMRAFDFSALSVDSSPAAPRPTSPAGTDSLLPPSYSQAGPSPTSSFNLEKPAIPTNAYGSNSSPSPFPAPVNSSLQSRMDAMKAQQGQPPAQASPSQPIALPQATASIPTELLTSMNSFMATVDNKLQAMENQLRKLTLDFHQASSKQEQNTEVLSRRLDALKTQMAETRSSVTSALPSAPAQGGYPVLSASPSPAERNPFLPPSGNTSAPKPASSMQEDADAAIAKRLQEEFDREQEEQQRQRQQEQQAPSSQQVQYQPQGLVAPGYPPAPLAVQQSQQGQQVQREECPLCGVSFPIGKELMEHANSHFPDGQMVPQQQQQQFQQQMIVRQQQPQQQRQPDEPGFFAKIFGSRPKPPQQQPYYANPQQQAQAQAQYQQQMNRQQQAQQAQQAQYYQQQQQPQQQRVQYQQAPPGSTYVSNPNGGQMYMPPSQ